MTAPDESGNGPVIRDHRRIDPVTGQPRRGKHAATSPAGTTGAGRPGGTPGSPGRHGKGDSVDRDVPEASAEASEEMNEAAGGAPDGGTPTEAAPSSANGSAEVAELQTQLAERTA